MNIWSFTSWRLEFLVDFGWLVGKKPPVVWWRFYDSPWFSPWFPRLGWCWSENFPPGWFVVRFWKFGKLVNEFFHPQKNTYPLQNGGFGGVLTRLFYDLVWNMSRVSHFSTNSTVRKNAKTTISIFDAIANISFSKVQGWSSWVFPQSMKWSCEIMISQRKFLLDDTYDFHHPSMSSPLFFLKGCFNNETIIPGFHHIPTKVHP